MRTNVTLRKVIWSFTWLIISLTLFGCRKDLKTELYAESYDALTSYYIDIDTLAKGMNVSVADLVKIRYGLMDSNPKLAEELNKLLSEYQKYNHKGVKKILEKKHEFALTASSQNNVSSTVLLQNYRKIVLARNEDFQTKMPKVAGNQIVNNVEKYIDKEFAWYRFPINGWNRLIKGKEKAYDKYHSQISSILSEQAIDSCIVVRFNDYESLMQAECATLFGKSLQLTPLKGITYNSETALTSQEMFDAFVKRSNVELTDLLLTVIEEVGVALIVWLIFSIVINRIENYYAKQEIGYVPGAGWWNIAFTLVDMWNYWEKDKAVSKWKRIKAWTQGIVFVIFFVLTWIYVIKPAGVLENDIMTNCETHVIDYIENINLPLQEYFNNIIETEL